MGVTVADIWPPIALGIRAFAWATGPNGKLMLHPDDLIAITTAFADLEANLEWAIARQDMRLRCLSDDIRRNVPPRAKTQGAWLRRLTRNVARLRNMGKAARRLAWRMASSG